MTTVPTFAFLGAGNMAEALIRGLLRAGRAQPGAIIATGRRRERLADLRHGGQQLGRAVADHVYESDFTPV